jgi:hypothetical protein
MDGEQARRLAGLDLLDLDVLSQFGRGERGREPRTFAESQLLPASSKLPRP